MESERKHRKPNRMIFTEKNVMSLRSKRKQYMVWDGGIGRGAGEVCRGLGILVSPLGARSYRSTFYFPGSPKSHTRHLGRVGVLTLEEARKLCREDQRKARHENKDPRLEDVSKSDKYKECVEDYVKREQIGKKNNVAAQKAERVLLADCPDWWDRPIKTIRNTEIQRLLELVRDGDEDRELRARPYLANLLYARLKPFFKWCARGGIEKVEINPMLDIEKPWHGAKRRERDWFKGEVGDEAINAIWQAADKLDATQAKYTKLMMLTGKRADALANMRWEEIDKTWFWNAPPGSANKRNHAIPLSNLAQRILHPRQESGFVFPGRGEDCIKPDTRLKKKVINGGAPADFFFHGIKHIVETKMGELKIAKDIRDMLLDHADRRGAGKVYDHHDYVDEMRAASETWSNYVAGLVQPEGVALLR